jgi:hypothetical protein
MTSGDVLFSTLEGRFNELSRKYVAHQIPSETDLSFSADTDHIAAFRLLVHAEIEDYLERKARVALQNVSKVLATDDFDLEEIRIVFNLAIYFGQNLPLQLPFDMDIFREAAKGVVKCAEKFIDGNNGIKSNSLLVFCLILDKSIDKVDPVLVQLLNDFGKARGDVAHKSVSRVTTIQAPSAEYNSAQNVISELRRLFEVIPWKIETAIEDDAIEKTEISGQEYSFWLKMIPIEIKVKLSVNPISGGFNFDLSHFIHTPKQIGPYRPSRPWGDDQAYALRLAVTAITQYYKQAVDAGLPPSSDWLVPNKYWNSSA